MLLICCVFFCSLFISGQSVPAFLLVETEGDSENKDSSTEEITATNLKEVGGEENEESDEGQIVFTPVAGMDYKRPGKKWAPIPGSW